MTFDAVVIGSGPNGLAAAIELARNHLSVCIIESANQIGGGARSAEWTLPGFIHDTCSAIHPLAYSSPFFCQLPLDQNGLKWVFPDAAVAHPLDDGNAVILDRSVGDTAKRLGKDAVVYARLNSSFVRRWDDLAADILGPIHLPQHPVLMARFGAYAVRPASSFIRRYFVTEEARALFAGLAGHSILPLQKPGTTAFGLVLGVLGHVNGWPFAEGGSQTISGALGSYFRSLGGTIVTGTRVKSLDELPQSRAVLCDLTIKEFLKIAGPRLPEGYRQKLQRFRCGPGVFKIDWALNSPIPWKAQSCLRAATVHIGGSFEEIESAEAAVGANKVPQNPFIILAQQSLFDKTRAPAGMHTAWGYCHVPNGCDIDMTSRIENQIERFAPGFKDCIIARHTTSPAQMESYNPNYTGGDINGGAADLQQIIQRPVLSREPYATPIRGLFICSSSTPPGGGVHGMCGYHAARAALRLYL